jgi:predicted permease
MIQDVRYAWRNLRRSPLFTLVAVLSLALGIGANTAIFTIADQVLLRLLPVRHARELVVFTSDGPQTGNVWGSNRFSYPMYVDFRDHRGLLASVAARFSTPVSIAFGGRSEQARAELVTGAYFDTLGLETVLGRPLLQEDDRTAGGSPVTVLTYDYWKSHFGANPSILNQTIRVNGFPLTVVGVAAAGYRGFDVGERTDLLVPTMMKTQMTPTWNGLDNRRVLWLQYIGRLGPGVTPQRARASLEPFYRSLLQMELQQMGGRSGNFAKRWLAKPLVFQPAMSGISDMRDTFRTPLKILLGIVGLLLLIACANVANLLLARAAARQKEIAVRLAIGASRFRLMRQLIVESLALSLAGGAAGLVLAKWTAGGLLGLLQDSASLGMKAELDLRIFLFTALLAVACGLIFGLAPALQATSPALAGTLKDLAGNVSAGSGHVRLRKTLVSVQVALSLVMLIAATLFARSLHNLKSVDLGFRTDKLFAFALDPSLNGYKTDRVHALADSVQRRMAAIPGVQSAAIGVNSVVSGNVNMSTINVVGYQAKEDENMNPYVDTVSPGYFATMGIPLLRGRDFTEADRAGAPAVAIVNDAFAKYFFHDEDPLGRRFAFGRDKTKTIEIVAVVRGSKYEGVTEEKAPRELYRPMQQTDDGAFTVYVRSSSEPKALFGAVQREVASLDASLPVTGLRTMEEQVNENLSPQRLMATLSALFGGLATLLAAVGLYGVMAYMVTRRTREIGIRLALGANRANLLGLVMREVAILTAAGVLVAVPASLALSRYVRSQLYGLAPTDALSIVAASGALVAVALLAGYIPAERATRVNPTTALRWE